MLCDILSMRSEKFCMILDKFILECASLRFASNYLKSLLEYVDDLTLVI